MDLIDYSLGAVVWQLINGILLVIIIFLIIRFLIKSMRN